MQELLEEAMLTIIWRQRRRFAMIALAGGMAGLVMNSAYPAMLAPLIAVGLCIALIAALMLGPDWRLLVTRLAIWIFAGACISQFFVPFLTPAIIAAAAVMAVFVRVPQGLKSWIRLPGIVQLKAVRKIDIDPELLWERLFPHETDNHWDPTIDAIQAGRTPGHFFIAFTSYNYYDMGRMPIRVYDVDPGRSFKVRDLSQYDVDDGGSVRVTHYVIGRSAAGSRLTLHEGTWRPEVVQFLNRWLDDILGDELEHVAAQLEHRRDFSITARGWFDRVSDIA